MEKNVHTEYCCSVHGCDYGDSDCPVTTGKQAQSFDCETCQWIKDAGDAKDRRVLTLEAELTAARAEIERLRDTLRQVQWGNCNWIPYADDVAGFTVSMCPMCDQTEDRGHAPDCLVGMCLEPK